MKIAPLLTLKYICVFISFSLPAQTTVTLQVSKDVAIGYHDGANTSGNNYGSALQNAAYVIPSVASPVGYNGNRALIDFNLSSIPAGAAIVSASLNLYALGPYGSVPGHLGSANASYLQRITQNWGEYTATWNNQPPSVTQNQVTLNQSTSPVQDYLNINVTGLVQDMFNNPATSFGFLLKLVNEVSSNALVFASKDCGDLAKWPTLIITYRSCQEPLNIAINALPSSTVCAGSSIQLNASGAVSYIWMVNLKVISQQSSVIVNPSVNTQYTVYGSDINGCNASSQISIKVEQCTGIEKSFPEGSVVNLYPNPNSGTFFIEALNNENLKRVDIIDLQGRVVKIQELPSTREKFEIKDLDIPAGVYFCRILCHDNSLITKKISIKY